MVISTKMDRTVIVRRDYLRYVSKYRRYYLFVFICVLITCYSSYEKRHKNLAVHCSPAFLLKEGDIVTIGQCRYSIAFVYFVTIFFLPVCVTNTCSLYHSPLSKTVRFNVLQVDQEIGEKFINVRKQFRMF
jgi:small subunit ribosomal protein S11e